MIFTQVSSTEFNDRFLRSSRATTFSYAARAALFEYVDQLADDTNTPIELDIVALCCEWAEHPSAASAAEEYGHVCDDDDDDDEAEKKAIKWLYARTQVIEFDGGILLQWF